MELCDAIRSRMFLYLDDELRDWELTALESHVRICTACRAAISDERDFLAELRSMRPIFHAPIELRSRVEEIVQRAQVDAGADQRRPGSGRT